MPPEHKAANVSNGILQRASSDDAGAGSEGEVLDDSPSNSEAEGDAGESQQQSPVKEKQQYQQNQAKEDSKPAKGKTGEHKDVPMARELSDIVSILRGTKLASFERNLSKRMQLLLRVFFNCVDSYICSHLKLLFY